MCGQADDGGGVERSGEVAGGEDGLMQGLGCLVVGDEQERGSGFGQGLEEERQVEGAGGEGETRDAAARACGGTARLQVASDAVEGVVGFEVGEEIADERKDHARDSLSGTLGAGVKCGQRGVMWLTSESESWKVLRTGLPSRKRGDSSPALLMGMFVRSQLLFRRRRNRCRPRLKRSGSF